MEPDELLLFVRSAALCRIPNRSNRFAAVWLTQGRCCGQGGQQLGRVSSGRFRPLLHRVQCTPDWCGDDATSARFSQLLFLRAVRRTIVAGIWVAFFQEYQQQSCGQAPSTIINPLPIPQDDASGQCAADTRREGECGDEADASGGWRTLPGDMPRGTSALEFERAVMRARAIATGRTPDR